MNILARVTSGLLGTILGGVCYVVYALLTSGLSTSSGLSTGMFTSLAIGLVLGVLFPKPVMYVFDTFLSMLGK